MINYVRETNKHILSDHDLIINLDNSIIKEISQHIVVSSESLRRLIAIRIEDGKRLDDLSKKAISENIKRLENHIDSLKKEIYREES